ncbi:LamG-like jellyroll fold domain-containing protein [Streptomyces sp. NPDC049577]|uniref:LamG-like jellyroll fold domain-containing protein n=1 Tax=Streptomyces sp. NPDC049577 TaxID=3155153 RepID=UPI00341D208B
MVQERSETEQVFANPSGTFTAEQTAQPQRVRQPDGSWQPVDAGLVRRQDGSVGPRSAVVDISFSGGGTDQPLIRMAKGDKSLALRWPGKLPEPRLNGATAEYSEVMPGVDLKVNATVTGYSYALVVKNAEAAKSPDLKRIVLAADTKGLSLTTDSSGLHALNEKGEKVFSGPPAHMWDSSGRPAPAASNGEPGTSPAPGDKVAPMAMSVQDGTVTVVPDQALLTGSGTRYPVYIDPPTDDMTQVEWLYVSSSSPDTSFLKDERQGRGVGYCSYAQTGEGWAVCSRDSYVDRMYFKFRTSGWKGRKIHKATFSAEETFSFSCTPTWVDLALVDEKKIGKDTTWNNKPVDGDLMVDRKVAYGRGDQCPSARVEFYDNPDEKNENLTPTVRKVAATGEPIAFSLTASDEKDPYSWKRFRGSDAKLSIEYNTPPNKPSDGRVSGTSTCERGSGRPWIRSSTPTMMVRGTDDDQQNLKATFRVWNAVPEKPMVYEGTDGYHAQGDFRSTIAQGKLQHGQAYKWHTGTTDGIDDSTEWSDYCEFAVDTEAPNARPAVSSRDFPAEQEGKQAGQPGSFTFSANGVRDSAYGNDIAYYEWAIGDDEPANRAVPSQTGGDATVNITPTTFGPNVLYARGVDRAGNRGPMTTYVFKPVRPCPDELTDSCSAATYHLDQLTSGTSPDGSGKDRMLGVAGAAQVAGRKAASQPTDKALRFNGTGDHASAASPVDTRQAFTVSAWVRPTSLDHNGTVVSQSGDHAFGYALYYSTTFQRWIFGRMTADKSASSTEDLKRAMAVSERPARLNEWTHLTGTYDPQAKKIRLYVNGVQEGEASFDATLNAARGLELGRARWNDQWDFLFAGDVDDVRVHAGQLSNRDIAYLATP